MTYLVIIVTGSVIGDLTCAEAIAKIESDGLVACASEETLKGMLES